MINNQVTLKVPVLDLMLSCDEPVQSNESLSIYMKDSIV